MITEEAAKLKWCPMVRHEGELGGTFNRGAITKWVWNVQAEGHSHEGKSRGHCGLVR